MTKDKIISGLKMTMELFLFDPSTGETCEPDDLNELNRTTYDACKGAVELLENPEPHWIPVEQELPEYGKAVLTITQDETYEVNHVIDEECGEWFWENNGKVIAWCELPEPYKGVTE